MGDLKLNSYEDILEKCDEANIDIIRDIFKEYEIFKNEVENQINDETKEFIEIECNGHIYKHQLLIQFWDKKIKLMKKQIKKIEYFKNYTSAVRIELDNEVYFINASINDTKLAILMNEFF